MNCFRSLLRPPAFAHHVSQRASRPLSAGALQPSVDRPKPGAVVFWKKVRHPLATLVGDGAELRKFDLNVSFDQLKAAWDLFYTPGTESLSVSWRYDSFMSLAEVEQKGTADDRTAVEHRRALNELFDRLAADICLDSYRERLTEEHEPTAVVVHTPAVEPTLLQLKNGASLQLRTLNCADIDEFTKFLTLRCSKQAFRQRFPYAPDTVEGRHALARQLIGESCKGRKCSVVQDDKGSIVGFADYIDFRDRNFAEVDLLVADQDHREKSAGLQGQGLGFQMLTHLIAAARADRFKGIVANVADDNAVMLNLMAKFTPDAGHRDMFVPGHLQFRIPLRDVG